MLLAFLFIGLPLPVAGCGLIAYFLGRDTHRMAAWMTLAAGFSPYVIVGGFLKIIPIPTFVGMLICWGGAAIFAAGLIGFLRHRTASSRKAVPAAVLGSFLGVGHAMVCTYPFIVEGSSFNIR